MPLSDKDKKIAYSILKHLKSQISNGVIDVGDDKESIEVAIQCIAATYGLENESENKKYSTKATLEELFSRQEEACAQTTEAEHQLKAEELKEQGNRYLKDGQYQEAVDCYSEAIELVPNSVHSATYYCNRAAAYIKLQDLQKALQDCNVAIEKNPNYARAYARKGSVYNMLSNFSESKVCFTKAVELEPQNESYRTSLEAAEQQVKTGAATSGPAPYPQGGGAAPGVAGGPFGGMGGGGGGFPNLGGMNLGNLLSNPAFMNMASSLMQTPAFQNIASQMMGSQPGGGGGGGMAGMMPQFQQATQQLQQENPELYEAMRRQAAQVGNPPNPSHPKPE